MSLHKFAQEVASKGRGDDSLLIHMTPDEVQRLQAFAQANGRSLTINPETGLPEAGMLSDLFKAVAPLALGAFLGPGAFGIAGMGLSAGMAGAITGGITTLATGSLSRGLMAGLGAYGGAGLAGSLMNAGTGALSAEVGGKALAEAGLTGADAYSSIADETVQRAVGPKLAAATPAETLSAGFKAATANPAAMGTFAKNNLANIGMAAAPIMAGMMVPTTTKMPDPRDRGYIRQMAYNKNPFTGMPDPLYGRVEMAPVKASDFGNKTFQGQRDLFYQQNPNPYELGVGSLNQPPQQQQPTPMNTGGIVALADGGVAHYEEGGGVSYDYAPGISDDYFAQNKDVADAYEAYREVMSPDDFAQMHYDNYGQAEGRTLGAAPVNTTPVTAVNNTGITTLPVGIIDDNVNSRLPGGVDTTGGIGSLVSNEQTLANKPVDWTATTKQWITDNPFATPEQIAAATTGSGAGTQNVNAALDALVASGQLSAAERNYITQGKGLSGLAANNMQWLKEHPNATNQQITDIIKASGNSRDSALLPLTHGYQVAEDKDSTAAALKYLTDNKDVAKWVSSTEGQAWIKEHPEFDAKDIAWTHYVRYGKDEKRKWGVDKVVTAVNPYTGVASDAGPITTTALPTTPRTNAPPGTSNPYGNINNPGDLTFNNDGTVTVQPNIPGRPYGGFSGMDEVKDAYTAGGGSLGYTSPVVKTAAEHNAAYNKLTDDSLDAYNFLMGKGKNLTQRKATRGQPLAQRYDEAILGKKAVPRATTATGNTITIGGVKYNLTDPTNPPPADSAGTWQWDMAGKRWVKLATAAGTNTNQLVDAGGDGVSGPGPGPGPGDGGIGTGPGTAKNGGLMGYALGGLGTLGGYSDGGRLLRGPGDGVSDSIPATIGAKNQPARLADGEFVVPARIVSELGNGSTDAGAKKLYAMMDRVQRARGKTTGKNKVAANSRSDKYLPA